MGTSKGGVGGTEGPDFSDSVALVVDPIAVDEDGKVNEGPVDFATVNTGPDSDRRSSHVNLEKDIRPLEDIEEGGKQVART